MIFIIESLVLCTLFSLIILKLMKDPIKIMSYPPAIRRRVESLPQYQGIIHQEKKEHLEKKLLSLPIIVLMLAFGCWIAGAKTFKEAFFHGFGLFLMVNLWDLVVLDWLWFCRSKRVRLAGTEDMDKEYSDPWFHLRGFFKGTAIGTVVSLLSAGLIGLVCS